MKGERKGDGSDISSVESGATLDIHQEFLSQWTWVDKERQF